jgi:hypothetical protein
MCTLGIIFAQMIGVPSIRKHVSHPILRPKSDAHRMCAQDQDFTHTARIAVIQIKPVS